MCLNKLLEGTVWKHHCTVTTSEGKDSLKMSNKLLING